MQRVITELELVKVVDISRERELLKQVAYELDAYIEGSYFPNPHVLLDKVENLLAQTEQTEQEPVAWITEWVQRYRHNDTPIMDRAVSFTKGGAPAVPNPNYIPLYTSPPKHEPLSDVKKLTHTALFKECRDLLNKVLAKGKLDFDLSYEVTQFLFQTELAGDKEP